MPDGRKVITVPMDLFHEAEENHDALGIADSRDTLVIATSLGMLSLLMCRYARENGIDDRRFYNFPSCDDNPKQIL